MRDGRIFALSTGRLAAGLPPGMSRRLASKGATDEPDLTDLGAGLTCGVLTKQGGKFKNWRKRFFVLSGLRLRWYEDREEFESEFADLTAT